MSDTKSSMSAVRPEEKPTVEMGAVPAWAIALSEKVTKGFEGVDTRLTTIEGNQTLQGGQVLDIGRRMTEMERRVGGMEDRQTTNSVRVRSTTDENLKQDSAISSIVVDVASLKETQATQLAILQKLDKVAANPMVRRVAYAVGTATLGYLASRGMK